MLKPCVVFDLDGTLADTSGDLLAAANCCFRALGLGDLLAGPADAGTALRGGRAMLSLGFSRVDLENREAEIDRQYPKLLQAYEQDTSSRSFMYPRAVAALRDLKKAGFCVAICTNKPEGLARKLFAELNLLDEFDALIGADTLPVRKPDAAPFWAAVKQAGGDPKRAIMVGDTVTDRDTAANADVPCILVTFGPAGGDMAALNPAALLDDYADLSDVVARLMGAASSPNK